MEKTNPWPMEFGGEKFSEREVRFIVERQKAMFDALQKIEEFAETGKLPVLDGVEKKQEEVITALGNWERYCEDHFEGEKKKEMQDKLQQLREKVEARIAGDA